MVKSLSLYEVSVTHGDEKNRKTSAG